VAINYRREVDHDIDQTAANVVTFRYMAKTYLTFAKSTKRMAHEARSIGISCRPGAIARYDQSRGPTSTNASTTSPGTG
jgi:hypothetical protein